MTAGTLANAFKLDVAGFGDSTINYGFYSSASDLSSSTASMHLPYPAQSSSSNPTYADSFESLDATLGSEQTIINELFSGQLTSVLDVAFNQTSDLSIAQVRLGALDWTVTVGDDHTNGWASAPNASDGTAGDGWLLENARISSSNRVDPDLGFSGDLFYYTSVHEIGHTLGLDDAKTAFLGGAEDSQQFTVMSSLVDAGSPAYEFQLYDIAALQHLYGANSSWADGNTTYDDFVSSPSGATGDFDRKFSIWDGGGHDKIDAHTYEAPSFIDLRPGHFSTIGDHANPTVTGGVILSQGFGNVSIAFGAQIEDAVGIDQNDGLVGTAYGNSLNGGAGDDVIYGDGDLAPGSLGGTTDYEVVSKGGAASVLTVDGSAYQDTLDGEAGNDLIVGAAGADHLIGGTGEDSLRGGNGDDSLLGSAGNDSIEGGAGNDTLIGGADGAAASGDDGVDTLTGGAGNDLITAGGGDGDSIVAGDGNDRIVVAGDNATINGGAGDDLIDATRTEPFNPTATVVFGNGSGHDYLARTPDEELQTGVSDIDLSTLNSGDVTWIWNKTYDHTFVGENDGTPVYTEDTYTGDVVLNAPDGSTLYLGQMHGYYYYYLGEDGYYTEYCVDNSYTLHFADGDRTLAFDLIQESTITVGSVTDYAQALANWVA